MPDYTDVWDRYDLAVSGLYDVLGPTEASAAPTVRSPELASRADLVVTASSRLAEVAMQDLVAPGAPPRERAMLRLVAGAAADVAIANDLVRAQGEPAPIIRGVTFTYPQLMSELGPILRPGDGLPEITTRGPAFRPLPQDPSEALEQLRWHAGRTFDDIAQDVTDVGEMAISGLLALEAAPVKQAAAVAAQEVLAKLGEGVETVVRRAAQLVVMAYDKILLALGKDAASQARRQAAEWIEMLRTGTLFDQILAKLYEKERILADIEQRAKAETTALMSQAFSTILQETRALAGRFENHRRSVEWILRGLAFTKDWLFTRQPWGPLAGAAVYVGSLGYVVYAGGDYIDWFRTGEVQALNRVPGLREVVRETLRGDAGSAEG